MGDRRSFYEQIMRLPQTISERMEGLTQLIQDFFGTEDSSRWSRVFLTGCGDSYYAGLASELAWERLAGLPAEPMTSFQFGRYAVTFAPADAILFVLSYSGEVARTIEAALLAKKRGIRTIAITANPHSRLVRETDRSLVIEQPPLGDSPGVSSYLLFLLTLLLCSIYAAEARSSLEAQDIASLKRRLNQIGPVLADNLAIQDDGIKQVVQVIAQDEEGGIIFLGGGPNYGTALFSAAKVIEACGLPATAQDIEEWAHVQCFTRKGTTHTFVLAPRGSCLERGLELLEAMRKLGRQIIWVSEQEVRGPFLKQIRIYGDLREEFSPLIYGLPGALLAYYLAEIKQTTFFRLSEKEIGPLLAHDIRKSRIIKDLPFG